jgi:uncharacterized protein YndB with AHSA1/START domain
VDNFVADAIYVDAPPARVFSALTEPEDVLSWMDAERAVVDARAGGRFTAVRADGSTVTGGIAVYEPDTRLEIEEYFHEKDGERRGPMHLRFHLVAQGDGVWLTVRQDGLDTAKGWEDFARETRRELVRSTVALKRHVEGI